MIDLALIGIGTGNPDHLTAEAVRAMNEADVILLPDKGAAKSDLIDLRRAMARLAPHQIYLCGLLAEADLSAADVALKLGIPRGVLYRELQRIRAVFAEVGLGDYLDE